MEIVSYINNIKQGLSMNIKEEFRDFLDESITKDNEEKFWSEIKNKVNDKKYKEIRDFYNTNYDRSYFDNYNYTKFKRMMFKKFNISNSLKGELDIV